MNDETSSFKTNHFSYKSWKKRFSSNCSQNIFKRYQVIHLLASPLPPSSSQSLEVLIVCVLSSAETIEFRLQCVPGEGTALCSQLREWLCASQAVHSSALLLQSANMDKFIMALVTYRSICLPPQKPRGPWINITHATFNSHLCNDLDTSQSIFFQT